VVDDAIVVIENVQRHIHMEHSDAHEATSRAMREVTSAVIATSLVLIAVFVPVSFFPGTTGILYRQFSLTIAFSIAISAFNALTLSPALSAIFFIFARSHVLLPQSSMASMDLSHGRPAPTRASSMLRCGCATFFCWCFLPGWALPCGCTGTFPPGSSRRKIRDSSW
jgi:multidrug efflux pump subunit AcrB